MEKIKKNKKTIIIALLILIVIAGVIVTLTVGLNFDLRYQDTKKIELYIGKTFEYNDIKILITLLIFLQQYERDYLPKYALLRTLRDNFLGRSLRPLRQE